MPAPINYAQGFTNPMDSIMQTLQLGNALGQMGQIRDQRAAAQQAAEAKAARDAEIQAAFEAARENPTYDNYRKLADMSPPEQAESFRKSWAMLDGAQQRQALNDTVSIYAGFQSGAPEISLSMIEKRIEAAKNAGDAESAQRYQAMLDMANSGPEGVKAVKDMFAMSITGMTGGKEAMEALGKLGEEQRAATAEPTVQKKRLADIGFTEAQTNKVLAETKKLGIESDKLTAEIEKAKKELPAERPISAGAEKLVNDSVIAAAKAKALTGQYSTLANDFEKAISTAGVGAKVSEQVSRIFGTEKEPTALRQEYLRLRNTAVLEMLPPGVASDKDIEIALAAFPTETSSPANIAGFLRGMSKLQAYEAALESSKAEWIQQNGTLGTASTTMQVGNRTVKPGERFTDFIQQYVPNTSVLGTGGAPGATYGSGTGGTLPAAGGARSAPEPVVEGDF